MPGISAELDAAIHSRIRSCPLKSRNATKRIRRSTPFALAGLFALASTLLPPGPRHPVWLVVAIAIAAVLAIDGVLGFTEHLPSWVSLLRLVLAVVTSSGRRICAALMVVAPFPALRSQPRSVHLFFQ